jgi:isoquinoline 1-oxidoreductase
MRLTVNGKSETVDPRAEFSLLHVLREELDLTAAKPGCGEGECGACSVLVDGTVTRSCVTSATSVADRNIDTLEGLRSDNVWATVVGAFADERAFQCGYCTPGMVVVAGALLRSNPDASADDIIDALNGNICRCGTYPRILRAISRAADSLRAGRRITWGPSDARATDSTDGDFRFDSGAPTPWDMADPGDRDWFVRLGEGLMVVLPPDQAEHVNEQRGGAWSTQGGAWLHVAPDGHVTAFTGKVDVGQDNRTALTAVVARELNTPAEGVDLIMGDTDFCPFDIGTFGSRSTEDAGGVLAAAASAACAWIDSHGGRVAPGTATTINASANFDPRPTAEIHSADLDRRSAFDIASGRTHYTSDVRVDGMVDGRALRPPVHGARLDGADASQHSGDSEARLVVEDALAGVVASDAYLSEKALSDMHAKWDSPERPSDADLQGYLRSHPIEERGWEGAYEDSSGDPDAALTRAAQTYEATFTTSYIAHAPLETRCAVATWRGDRVTVLTGTQRPFGVREQVADELGVSPDRVRVIVPPTGSGYGGKHTGEAAIEAARLARATGKPVKVRWSRADEFRYAYFRPAAVIDIGAGLGEDGRITAWQHTNINSGPMGIGTPYQIPDFRVRYQPADSPLRTGSYRALAATANNFARESAMDELAHMAGEDPVDFRLRHLDDDRLSHVLWQVADRGRWNQGGKSGDGALGIACGFEKDGRIATLVEIEQAKEAEFRLRRIVAAYDCGAIVDPNNLRNQIEGALVMGLGGALFERIRFDKGRVTNGSMKQYRVPRFRDVPDIEVILVDQPKEPSVGAGETPIIAIAPAVANAIFALTGERRRSLPLLP